ncbi:MAG TPA: N-acetylmuramoyl-L-alanine amidase [Actinomycetaceae bacterium]|nr:N-acetylmuramoyl-L-alanine amidase [Actinomycetaceae bacterium]
MGTPDDTEGGAARGHRPRRGIAAAVVAAVLVAAAGIWVGVTYLLQGGLPWAPSADTVAEEVAASSANPRPAAGPTPSAPPPTSAPALPLEGVRVVLDPGHNSDNASNPRTIGAQVPDGRGGTKACNTVGTSTFDGYPEHAFTWDVADRTRAFLEDDGAEVFLTRGASGVGPCVDARGQAPGVYEADLMISIHGNGSESQAARGFFVMVVATPLHELQGEPSQMLAEDVASSLEEAGFPVSNVSERIGLRNDLATLNHATRPSVMVELAEFRNPEESQAVQDPEVRARYARALADAVAVWSARD